MWTITWHWGLIVYRKFNQIEHVNKPSWIFCEEVSNFMSSWLIGHHLSFQIFQIDIWKVKAIFYDLRNFDSLK